MSQDTYTVVDGAKAATRMARHGVPKDEIVALLREELSKADAEQAYAWAKLRKEAADRFQDPWPLFFDETGLRYATPDTVARHRAARLEGLGDTVADLACGVGIQLAFLAHRFDDATGIEIDPERAELAKANLDALDADAEIIVGDCLDEKTIGRLGPVDVFICDPARGPSSDKRTLDELSPDPLAVLDAWGDGAVAWCFELPPMMPPERVREDLDGELEYTSLNRDLNRLAVYGGQARECNVSAVALPAGERLTDQDEGAPVEPIEDVGDHVYLVDRTVLQAGLLEQLVARTGAVGLLSDEHPRRTLLTGDGRSGSAFCTDYEILASEAWNLELLRGRLERVGAGKVTLRASIDPDDYWAVRTALEEGLEGDRHVHLFNLGDDGLIVEERDR